MAFGYWWWRRQTLNGVNGRSWLGRRAFCSGIKWAFRLFGGGWTWTLLSLAINEEYGAF
jgi:hypothetical protein